MNGRTPTFVGRALVALITLVVLSSLVAAAAGATLTAPEPSSVDGSVLGDEPHPVSGDVPKPALVVEVSPSGDATVTLVSTYDLTSAEELAAFEDLQADESAQEALRDRFTDRMDGLSETMAPTVEREIAVSAGSTDVRIEGETGIVSVTVTWTGLAEATEDRLVITEPFASGYQSDRALVIVGPEGSSLSDATPEPETTDGQTATWEAETDLSGFEATFTLEAGADDADGLPGFGLLTAVSALFAALVVATRMRS